jgi:cytidylate kinase
VTISRESGVDAGEIARLVAAQSNWKVLDRGILDYMAERYHWSRVAVEDVDERTASWFYEVFGKWLDAHLVTQAEFVRNLGKILLMAAQHEPTVFVGRGARYILPRDRILAVRITAPKKMRIQRIIERRQCNRQEAEKFIDITDEGRANFVKQYFHHDVANSKRLQVTFRGADLTCHRNLPKATRFKSRRHCRPQQHWPSRLRSYFRRRHFRHLRLQRRRRPPTLFAAARGDGRRRAAEIREVRHVDL